jgi:acyl-coenzyme A thioesterase PaaI-like protein
LTNSTDADRVTCLIGIAWIAMRLHHGRTIQVWDAEVTDEASEKTIALFRCTQLILYPSSRMT